MTKFKALTIFSAFTLCASIFNVFGMKHEESIGSADFEAVPQETGRLVQEALNEEFPGLQSLTEEDFFQTDWLNKVPASIFHLRPGSDSNAYLQSRLQHWKKLSEKAQTVTDAKTASKVLEMLRKLQDYIAVDKMSDNELNAQFTQYGQQLMMQSMILSPTKEPEGQWGSMIRDFTRYMLKRQIYLSLKQEAARN